MLNIIGNLGVAVCTALIAPAFAAEWMTNFDAAMAKAAAENKAVLADFTGSDWCGPCKYLKATVLNNPAFVSYAQDKFVLLEVDLPRRTDFDPDQLKRNQELARRYRVSGFPTLLVLTPEGLLVGGFVGGRMNVQQAIAALESALANIPAARTAERLEGEAQVKALYALYKRMPKELAESLRERIAGLDKDNTTGIHDEIRADRQMEDFQSMLYEAAKQKKDARATIALVNTALAEACPQNRAAMLHARMNLQIKCADSLAETAAIRQTLLEIAEADPANAEHWHRLADERYGDPELVLRALRFSRESLQKEQKQRDRQKK